MERLNDKQGFSLLDVVIGIFIISLIASGVFGVINANTKVDRRVEVMEILQDEMAATREAFSIRCDEEQNAMMLREMGFQEITRSETDTTRYFRRLTGVKNVPNKYAEITKGTGAVKIKFILERVEEEMMLWSGKGNCSLGPI